MCAEVVLGRVMCAEVVLGRANCHKIILVVLTLDFSTNWLDY
jgi:hypothetical protein